MQATIIAIHLDTGERDDLVLLASQVTQTVRAALAPPAVVYRTVAVPGDGRKEEPAAQLAAPAAATVTAEAPIAAGNGLYTTCQDCGLPKAANKSPICRRCALKRAKLRRAA